MSEPKDLMAALQRSLQESKAARLAQDRPETPIADLRAERDLAHRVVRLLHDTGGRCGARRGGTLGPGRCSEWPGHPQTSHGPPFERGAWRWTDADPGAIPSPWDPEALAEYRRIVEAGE